MAGTVAKDLRTYIDQYDLSAAFKAVKPHADVASLDATTFGASSAKAFLSGLRNGTLDLEGLFSADNVNHNQLDDVLGQAVESKPAPRVVTVIPVGGVNGNRAILFNANEVKYEVDVKLGQVIMATAGMQSTSGFDSGIVLHTLGAETSSGNSASQDNSALSSNGGAAHLHVTAVSGGSPTATIKVQHSVDNSTWVDLVTFTAATAATSQRVEVAAGATVNRYLRVLFTLGGSTPSFTFVVAFARR